MSLPRHHWFSGFPTHVVIVVAALSAASGSDV